MPAALRIDLPRPPAGPTSHPFPVLATVAPVIGALAIWAITGSAFAIAFAALGPVVALASVADSRVQSRRSRRRESDRFASDCEIFEETISQLHDCERADLTSRAPAIGQVQSVSLEADGFWRVAVGSELPVAVGTGNVQSTVEVVGSSAHGGAPSRTVSDSSDARLQELRDRARTLARAPVIVDASRGIGFFGVGHAPVSAARAVVLRLASMLSPASTSLAVVVPSVETKWLQELPHALSSSDWSGCQLFSFRMPGRDVVVAAAETIDDLPDSLELLFGLDSRGFVCRAIDHRSIVPATFHAELTSREHAKAFAANLTARATSRQLLPHGSLLPRTVSATEVLVSDHARRRGDSQLWTPIGVGEGSVASVDLVRDGPHAIIGGTTGSGKSELLVTWAIGMAQNNSPAQLNFLFVDFKGGASFGSLVGLRHCVGVITDLDAREAIRALDSLRAEVRGRERQLASASLRSIDNAAPGEVFPRLVIVVDEYAAMVTEHPVLHPLFADLAARGRSLGIHLILCTQSPAGVIRDGILANAGLRISLRVNNSADSRTIVASDVAANFPHDVRGRAAIRVGGSEASVVQIALAGQEDVDRVIARWADAPAPRRPWTAPLPATITLEGAGFAELLLDGPRLDVPFGLLDVPAEQRYGIARLDPVRDGHLLVLGGSGSGKSNVLAAIEAAPSLLRVERVGPDLAMVWDALSDILAAPLSQPARIVEIDDLDSLIAGCAEEYVVPTIDLISRALREGPAHGTRLAVTMQRIPGALQSVAGLFGRRLLLRMPSLQEHVLAGGDSPMFDENLPPGGGYWLGHRVQVALAKPTKQLASEPRCREVDGTAALAGVSRNPRQFARRVRVAFPLMSVIELAELRTDPAPLLIGDGSSCIIGEPEAWLAQWGALPALRSHSALMFDGCTIADVRAISASRELPPPPSRGERPLWMLGRDGSFERARLPVPAVS